MIGRTAAVVLVIGLLASAGCSSRSKGSGSSTAPTNAVVAAVSSAWVPVRDSETGIRFGLPAQPETSRTTQPSTSGPDVERRQYRVFVDLVQVTVTIDSGVDKPVRFGDPAAIATGLAAQSRAEGDRNIRIVDREQISVQGRPALDFRLVYTPKKWTDGRTVSVFVRAVQARAAMVVMQTFFPPPPDVSPSTGPALQAKLVAGLTLA